MRSGLLLWQYRSLFYRSLSHRRLLHRRLFHRGLSYRTPFYTGLFRRWFYSMNYPGWGGLLQMLRLHTLLAALVTA